MVKVIVAIVRLYQLIASPILGSNCRFYPTCSQYCIENLKTHGITVGLMGTIYRIARCNPWNRGGYDPVKPRNKKTNNNINI